MSLPTRSGIFGAVLCVIFLWIGSARLLVAAETINGHAPMAGVNDSEVADFFAAMPDPNVGRDFIESPYRDSEERYHWKGLLLESLEFNVIENSWRIASDDQIRDLLATKPYWHDYFASLRQFNMRRWNDGDSFVVNYVGHPLQGAVSGYIQIQNDPTGRMLEISASREYWRSRGLAFLWATLYSTQSEIGPVGEAAIGNEGGWTYPRGVTCYRPCSQFKPGVGTYTNNTGWVDFIITPVVGTLWILAEDTLDRFVSDPYQRHDTTFRLGYPKILRASLSPARSFANVMRGQKPWYRDWQPQITPYFAGFRIIQSEDRIE
jgi:hypothetical protein